MLVQYNSILRVIQLSYTSAGTQHIVVLFLPSDTAFFSLQQIIMPLYNKITFKSNMHSIVLKNIIAKIHGLFTSPAVDGSTAEYRDSHTTSLMEDGGPRGIPGKDSSQL